MKVKNKYFLLRHGETTHQVEKPEIIYFWPEDKPPAKLTDKGKEQIKKVAKILKKNLDKIDLIFSSGVLRTRQTAQIVAKELGVKVRYDRRLYDRNLGIFQGRPKSEFYQVFSDEEKIFNERPPKGENRNDLKKRLTSFLKEVEKKYKNKTILIVSHGEPLWLLSGIIRGKSDKELLEEKEKRGGPRLGELIKPI